MHRAKLLVGGRACSPPGARRACQPRSMPRPGLRPDTLSHAVHSQGQLAPQPARTSDNTRGTTVSPDLKGPSVSQLSVCSLQCGRVWGRYLSTGGTQNHHGSDQMRHVHLISIRMWCTPARVGEPGTPSGHGCIRSVRRVGRHDVTTDWYTLVSKQRTSDDVNKYMHPNRQAVRGGGA
jgi:hypothetical protein